VNNVSVAMGEGVRKIIEVLIPENRSLFHQRVLTEAVHELGHTDGLNHRLNPRCVMFFSNPLVDTERKGFDIPSEVQEPVNIP
jgi:predicted Zn-dependent protease